MSSGIYYFVNDADFDISKYELAISFSNNFMNNPSGYIYPDIWAINSATGVVSGNSNFFDYSGSGYFDGKTLVKLNKPVNLRDNSTIFLSFEKTRKGDEILLSSLQGNSFQTYSGFCLGVNDANKLYFKYWNNVEGSFTFTYNGFLSDKNLIIVQRNNSILSLGRLNNNTFEFDTENFLIKNNVFINSDDFLLGGANIKPPWLNNEVRNFSGFIDNIYLIQDYPSFYNNLFISGLIYDPKISNLTEISCASTGFLSGSGFSFTGITGYQTEIITTISTGVTGYISVLTGDSYIGITGYRDVFIGISVDNCGISKEIFLKEELTGIINNQYSIDIEQTGFILNTGFLQIELTGLITGLENIFITGERCKEIIIGESIDFLETNFLDKYSYSEISLLKTFDSGKNDNLEIFLEKYYQKNLYYNIDYIYNSLLGNFFDINDQNFELTLFANGQALVSSGYNIVTSGYDEFIVPNLDYIISGNQVETNRYFGEDDFLFYDYFSGNSNIFTLSNYTSGTVLPVLENENSFIFRNGQKLISGIDYEIVTFIFTPVIGLKFNFNITGDDPEIFLIKNNTPIFNSIFNNTEGTTKLLNTFNNGCSQVYYNGIRQKINNNYIENSNFDMISGTFFGPETQEIIYNNTQDFFV
jgi:hypothetical protein